VTRWRLKKDPATDAVAIYSVPSRTSLDNAPLANPLANKGRLQLHTSVILPSTTPEGATTVPERTRTVTINVPAVAANTKFQGATNPAYRFNLFAHGLGQPCMVEGRILNLNGAGNHVGFNGSVPVVTNAAGFGMWLALGSTATHVIVEAFGIAQSGEAIPAQSFDIVASAYDFLATGPAPTANPALPGLRHYKGSHTIIANGAIDTRRRYVRSTGIGPQSAIAAGETMKIIGRGIGDDPGANPSYVQNEIGWRWRYDVNGYVRQTLTAWNGSATNGGTYRAPFIRVKQ
jgi:hypothetical protein